MNEINELDNNLKKAKTYFLNVLTKILVFAAISLGTIGAWYISYYIFISGSREIGSSYIITFWLVLATFSYLVVTFSYLNPKRAKRLVSPVNVKT